MKDIFQYIEDYYILLSIVCISHEMYYMSCNKQTKNLNDNIFRANIMIKWNDGIAIDEQIRNMEFCQYLKL